MHRARYLIALIGLFALTGCAGQPAQPTNPIPSGGVYQPVCVSYVVLQDRIADFKALDPSTATVEDVKFAGRQVVGAYREFQSQAKNAIEGMAYLTQAERKLQAAVEQLPEGTTVQNAANALQDELSAFFAAVDAAGKELGCPIQ